MIKFKLFSPYRLIPKSHMRLKVWPDNAAMYHSVKKVQKVAMWVILKNFFTLDSMSRTILCELKNILKMFWSKNCPNSMQ